MSRTQYYQQLKEQARQVRDEFELATLKIGRSQLRKIFKEYQITFDLWPPKSTSSPAKFKKLRGAFFYDECGPTIMAG
jgi:hypothetical protein